MLIESQTSAVQGHRVPNGAEYGHPVDVTSVSASWTRADQWITEKELDTDIAASPEDIERFVLRVPHVSDSFVCVSAFATSPCLVRSRILDPSCCQRACATALEL